MPPQIYETPRSREGVEQYAGGGLTREYVVLYQLDYVAALYLVEQTAEVWFNGMERKQIAWRSLGAPDLWVFTVEYGAGAANAGDLKPDQLSLKIGAASAHITQSLATVGRHPSPAGAPTGTNLAVDATTPTQVDPDGYTPSALDVGATVQIGGTGWAAGAYTVTGVSGGLFVLDRSPAPAGTAGGQWLLLRPAPDYKGAIGVSLDTVQGCEIVVPSCEVVYSSNVRHMTDTLIRTLRGVVGKTNQSAFRGYPAGTLLYLGCEPTSSAGTLGTGNPFTFWNLAHAFRYEPDVVNFTLGDIFVPRKGGHEYLWCQYGPTAPQGAAALGQRPVAVYVERVYDSADFSLLGINL